VRIRLTDGTSSTEEADATFAIPAYVVTVNTDESSGNGDASNCVATGLGGDNSNCSLRDAVAAANALTGVTTNISFDPALMAGATTANPVTILIAQSTPITISQNVNIMGPGANLLTVEGGTTPLSTNNHAVFQQTGGNVLLSGMTVANGYGTINNGNGGAISASGPGTLTVANSNFSGNYGYSSGGAIFTQTALTVSNSTFSTNQVGNGGGGAIFAQSTLTVSNSTFYLNQAPKTGGAIHGSGSTTVVNSTFYKNSNPLVNGGAAIYSGGALTVSNSIFNDQDSGGGSVTSTGGGSFNSNIVYGHDSVSCSGGNGCNNSNQITANPQLSTTLGYYGGPTQTLLPLPGSSAICAGVQPTLNGNALSTDQRGVPISGVRYGQSACYDIGAVQTNYALSFSQQPSSVTVGFRPSTVFIAQLTENGSNSIQSSATFTDADGALTGGSVPGLTSGSDGSHNVVFNLVETGDTLTATVPLNSAIPLSLTATSAPFNIVADAASANTSSLSVNPSPAVAGSAVTVSATVVDAHNNPINGATAVFTTTLAHPASTATSSP
jgi:predicted outer membrane repeat protein